MIGKLISKFFGGGASTPDLPPVGECDLTAFVEYITCGLVDKPDEVSVEANDTDAAIEISIFCDKDDIGKVIGRSGKTIAAIRSLVQGAAMRSNKKASVEVANQ
jgi:predicted RNA-binding protein YlqC (UPF0109 family)